MSDRAALLDYAEQILDGTVALGARSARVAALLVRSAFEDWLDEQNPWAVTAPGRPTTASNSSRWPPARIPTSGTGPDASGTA